MSDFNVGIVKKFKKDILKNGSISLVLKSHDIEKLDVPRSKWNNSTLGDALIWNAGGGTYLINEQFLLLVKRSLTAQSNPGKLTIQTGLSDNEEEWIRPYLLKRELYEEVIIIDRENRKFLFPQIDNSAESIIRKSLEGTEYEDLQALAIDSEWVTGIEKDQIIILTEKEPLVSKGLLHHDENSLNILYCCKINRALPLDKILFFDSEFTVVNGEKKFLNREIFFYDLKNKVILDKNFCSVSDYEITEHAKYLIENIENNWR